VTATQPARIEAIFIVQFLFVTSIGEYERR
jgi:hypothetical protein